MCYTKDRKKEKERNTMKKIREHFELTKPYTFETTDLTAIIFAICAVMGIMKIDATVLFFIGSAIGLVTCLKARRINLLVLNGALFALNLVNIVRMFF